MLTCLLVLAGTTLATDDTRAPIVVSLVVERANAKAEKLTAEMIVVQLRARIARSGLRVLSREQTDEGGWEVRVTAVGKRHLQVLLLDDQGKLLTSESFSRRGRAPRDLAQTIALLAVESLEKLAPGIFEPLPDLPEEVTAFPPPPEPPPPVVATPDAKEEIKEEIKPAPQSHWTLGLSGVFETLLPTYSGLWGGGIEAGFASERWLVRLELVIWQPVSASTSNTELVVNQGVVRLCGGAIWKWDRLRFSLLGGLVNRLILAEQEGEGAAFTDDSYLAVGILVGGGVGVQLDALLIEARLQATNYTSHPRFFAGKSVALNTGHTAAELAVAVSWLL